MCTREIAGLEPAESVTIGKGREMSAASLSSLIPKVKLGLKKREKEEQEWKNAVRREWMVRTRAAREVCLGFEVQ